MLLDLTDPAAAPVRLDTSGRATEPDIHGATVVWKEADNVFAWGTLVLHDLRTGQSRMVATDPQAGIKSPSVGNRYVGFWGIDDTQLYLYDTKRAEMARVFEIAPTSEVGGAFRVEVAGDLAVRVQGTGAEPALVWARLPTLDEPEVVRAGPPQAPAGRSSTGRATPAGGGSGRRYIVRTMPR
jgi:hypothetical protein